MTQGESIDEAFRAISEIGKDLSDTVNFPSLKNMPVIQNPFVEATKANYASEFYDRLVSWINNFDADLDDEHEVGVRLVSFGQAMTFHLDSLGYWHPSLISFSGTLDDGDPVELIQHVSQISVLLMKMKRPDPEAPKRPIGFRGPRKESQSD